MFGLFRRKPARPSMTATAILADDLDRRLAHRRFERVKAFPAAHDRETEKRLASIRRAQSMFNGETK